MSGSRILVIEDEPAMLLGLKDAFTSDGCQVLVAADGEAGLHLARSVQPDLVLLDIMLPKVNGYEICRAVREAGLQMPIIMLTAKEQEEDIILGLNLGADDYITKPFSIRELRARVNAHLRRTRARTADVFRFGNYELNRSSHKLFRGGVEVELTAKEFRLMEYFASRAGCALSRNNILDAVWGDAIIVTPRSVDRCVTTLRAKIEPNSRFPIYIQTIRDIGYRFETGPESG